MVLFFILAYFICLLKAVIYLFNCKYYILCPFNALRKIYPKFCIKKAIIYERWWPFVVLDIHLTSENLGFWNSDRRLCYTHCDNVFHWA